MFVKKKLIAVLTATTLLITNVCSVFAANYCAGSTVFQESKTKALATTYCSYATSDHTLTVTLTATDVGGGKYTVPKTVTGLKEVQAYKKTSSGKTWSSASGEHKVYYRGTVSWTYSSKAPN